MNRSMWIVVAVVLLVSGLCTAGDVDVGGLVQARYKDDRHERSEFAVAAARLNAKVILTSKISAYFQLETAKEPNLTDAYVDYVHSKLIGARLGQYKLPFGFETQISRFYLETTSRSLVFSYLWNNGVSRNYVRDIGLTLMGRYKVFEYKLGVVNGAGYTYSPDPEFDGIPLFPGWGADNNNSRDIVGRIGMGIPMFAGLGFSFYQGEWPAAEHSSCNEDRIAKAFDLYLNMGKILFQYEHVWAEGRVDEEVFFLPNKYGGYYIVVGYRATPMIQPVYKIDICDPDKDTDGDRLSDMYCGISLNFERSARFQVMYRESKQAHKFTDSGFLAQMSAMF
jgi:hypothetical protein